jgi:hypothetical protein
VLPHVPRCCALFYLSASEIDETGNAMHRYVTPCAGRDNGTAPDRHRRRGWPLNPLVTAQGGTVRRFGALSPRRFKAVLTGATLMTANEEASAFIEIHARPFAHIRFARSF